MIIFYFSDDIVRNHWSIYPYSLSKTAVIWGMVEYLQEYEYIGLDKQKFQSKIVNISLSILFSICFGCSKNRLIETVL